MSGAAHTPFPTMLLVGRERELAALRNALDAALSGHGSLVLIGGAAGIGKTALAEVLLAEATGLGAFVLVGRCYDLSETPPYGPWAEALARLPQDDALPPVPDFGGGGPTSQAALLTLVRDVLAARAAQRPLVLLLDDLHWADPASLDLLRVVARDLGDLPLLLLATYRADELTRRQPLYALLPILVREARAARLDLRSLREEDVAALARGRYALPPADEARLVAYLGGHAEGNPLYAGELLRTLQEEGILGRERDGWRLGDLAGARVPPLLRQVIDARVDRLGEVARALLAVAAVIGQDAPLALWLAVVAADEDELLDTIERAVEARLLAETPDGAGVCFAHALIREALYAGTPPVRRRILHRRIAEALLAAREPDPDAVAYHLRRAGDPRAAEWLIRAGVRARRAVAWLTAAERYEAALGFLAQQAGRERERGWLLYAIVLLRRFSDSAGTLPLVDEAERLALAAGDAVLLAYARYQRGTMRCMSGAIRLGLADLERAVPGLEALPPDYHRRPNDDLALAMIEALLPGGGATPAPAAAASAAPAGTPQRSVLVNWLGHAGRYREALAQGEVFVALAPAGDPLRPTWGMSGYLGLGHALGALGRPDAARREYGRARGGLYAVNNAYMVVYSIWAELLHAVLPYRADDLTARAELTAEAARAWERAGGALTSATHGSPVDLLLVLPEGRWSEARRQALVARSSPGLGYAQAAIVALGTLARWQGEPDRAWEQVHALLPAGPDTAPGDCYFACGTVVQALAAELALDAGDLATARDWIAAHGRWLDWAGATLWRAEHRLLQARHARASGDRPGARDHAEAALACAEEPRQPLALLAARRALGELAAVDDRTVATDHLRRALALAEACATPYERALTLLALAEVHAAEGQQGEAGAMLAEARAILNELRARPALARGYALADRLATIAPTPPIAPTVLTFGLTAREAGVLRLLAEGLTDPQIAERLFVSRNTVATHLRAIYGKLGVNTRVAAARLAVEHGLA